MNWQDSLIRVRHRFPALIPGVLLILGACTQAAESPGPGSTLDLSGEWDFEIDPGDQGIQQRWYAGEKAWSRRIQVPGCWNAQGVEFGTEQELRAYERETPRENLAGPGGERDKLFHVFPGPAWYRQKITIPANWRDKVIFLEFGGVHRMADVWVNGQFLGTHVGYLVPFKYDISAHVTPGEPAWIVARVDGRRHRDIDPLMGCLDTLDFLFVNWGGIHRKVTLSAKARTWIEDVFVVPHVGDSRAEVRVELAGVSNEPLSQRPRTILASVLEKDGARVAVGRQSIGPGTNSALLSLSLPNPRLWSPDQPHLYTAEVQLQEEGETLDARSVRFGMRELAVREGQFWLNGKPIFLRGYGEDCIYPETIAPPVDRQEYRRRFAAVKAYGFNYARHHSWCPSEEYLDVADEMGVMLQPEFPIAYRWDLARSQAGRELYLKLWREMVIAHRNHPSIVTWCMGNELYDSFPEAPALYQLAKSLDPTRLVIDSDGVSRNPRDTLDFLPWQFAENSLGYKNSKYEFAAPSRPVIAHEMGYFVTLPDLDQFPQFQKGLRPYWLKEVRDLTAKKGLERLYPEWVRKSNLLQAECLKVNIEAARRSRLKGYSVWLFQDYPWCAEGVVNMLYQPKATTGPDFSRFNAPTVLLLDSDRRTFRSGEAIQIGLLASHFEGPAVAQGKVTWHLRGNDRTWTAASADGLQLESGRVQPLTVLQLSIPSLPTAQALTLEATLALPGGVVSNDWHFWVFPNDRLDHGALSIAGVEPLKRHYAWAKNTVPSAPEGGLLVTDAWNDATLGFLNQGGRVLLVAPEKIFPTVTRGFRPAGWDPSSREADLGTTFDPLHPALKAIPSEGWCDLQFYSLVQGARAIVLEEVSEALQPVVRCIDMPQRLWNKALLFEATVGKGRILVSGFNFLEALAAEDPAGEFCLDQLIRYGLGGEFNPRDVLAIEKLRPGDRP